jgi:hypothetical protein
MIFNPTFYGYGIGLVIIGWVCGLVIGGVFSALKAASRGI